MLNKLKIILLLCIVSFYNNHINGMDSIQQSIKISILEALMSNKFSIDARTKTFKFKNYKDDSEKLSINIEYVKETINNCFDIFGNKKLELIGIKLDPKLNLAAMNFLSKYEVSLILPENKKYALEVVRLVKFFEDENHPAHKHRNNLKNAIFKANYASIIESQKLLEGSDFVSLDEEINNFLEAIRSRQTSINYYQLYKFLNMLGIQLLDFSE